MKKALGCFWVLGWASVGWGATCTANTGARPWNLVSTWSCGVVPTAADTVIIPSGATISLDINTAAVISVTIDSGGVLQGDGTGKQLNIAPAGTNDLVNNGTIDFSGVVGVAGSSSAAVLRNSGATADTLDLSQTLANPSVWKFSVIDFNSRGSTLTNLLAIELSGNANPLLNTTTAITGALTATWTFSGTIAQTISAANHAQLTTWGSGTTNLVISNTAGVTLSSADTITGDLTLQTNSILTMLAQLTVSGNDVVMNAGSLMNLGGTTTTVPTATNRTYNASSTVRFTGTGTQTLPIGTYGNVTFSGSGAKRFSAGTTTIQGTFTKDATPTYAGTNNPVLNINGDMNISGTYTSSSGAITVGGNLILNAAATLNLNRSPTAMPTVTGTKTFAATSTVNYNANANQFVSAETYGNLTLTRTSGTRTRTPLAGTHTIVGNLTVNTGIVWAGNTNNPTVNIGGNITQAGTFTSGTGLYTFNGSGTQTISAAVTITNVNITNASASGLSLTLTHVFTNLTVSAGGVLSLAGTTTTFPTTTTRTMAPTSTVRFVGTGNQAIPAYTYGNLLASTGGTKTPAAGTLNIVGNLSVLTPAVWAGNTSNPTVNLGGNLTNTGTYTSGTGVHTFNGTVAQTVSGATAFGSVVIDNSTATGVTLLAATTITGNLTVNAGDVLTLGGTTTPMPTVSGAKSFAVTSTTRYAGTGAQVVAAQTYGNLVLTNGGTKTPAAGTLTIAGSFTLDPATTYSGANNPTVNIAGDFTNSGTFTSGTGIYTFNGAVLQNLTGATTFARLTMNSSAPLPDPVLVLNNDVTVSTTLGFTFGGIVTGSNKVIIPSGGAITGAGAGTGWIIGRLQRFIPAGASTTTFEVGTLGTAAPQLAYTPVSISFTGVGGAGGSMIVTNTQSDHPQIATSGVNAAETVNRWWSLSTSGVTGTALPAFTNYSATFTFDPTDLDVGVNTSNLFAVRYTGAAWTTPATGTRTATSTQATGVTALGEFAFGEPSPPTITKTSTTISDPVNNLSNPKAIPGAIKEFSILSSNGGLAIDSGTYVVTDTLNANIALYVNNFGSCGPVNFSNGTPSSGMTCSFTSLASLTDNIDFSSDNGATWTYVPSAGPNGCDTSVTNIRIRPQGVFASGQSVSPVPNFQLNFRVCIK